MCPKYAVSRSLPCHTFKFACVFVQLETKLRSGPFRPIEVASEDEIAGPMKSQPGMQADVLRPTSHETIRREVAVNQGETEYNSGVQGQQVPRLDNIRWQRKFELKSSADHYHRPSRSSERCTSQSLLVKHRRTESSKVEAICWLKTTSTPENWELRKESFTERRSKSAAKR